MSNGIFAIFNAIGFLSMAFLAVTAKTREGRIMWSCVAALLFVMFVINASVELWRNQ